MRLDKLTIKAQEALQEAQALAQKRLADRHVTLIDPLAMRLLDGSLKSNQTVTVDQNGTDKLSFSGS